MIKLDMADSDLNISAQCVAMLQHLVTKGIPYDANQIHYNNQWMAEKKLTV